MKLLKILAISILVIAVVLFVGTWLVLTFFGKQIIVGQLEKNLKTTVTLGSYKVNFPLQVTLEQLKLGTFADIGKLTIAPNVTGFLAGKVILDKVTLENPVITVEKSSGDTLNLPVFDQNGPPPPPVYLLSLSLKNGKVVYVDKKIDPNGYKITVDKLNVEVAKVAFPITSLKTDLDLSCVMLDPAGKEGGAISAKGWVDFGSKDMDATLDIADLEVTTLAPYLGTLLSQRKLVSAKGSINTKFSAVKDALTLANKVKFSHIVYKQDEAAASEEGLFSFAAVAKSLDTFADKNGEINFAFNLKTRLSDPKFTKKEIRKAIFEAVTVNLLGSTPEEALQNLPQTIERIKENKETFKEIGNTFKDMFKKQKEEEAPAPAAPQQ